MYVLRLPFAFTVFTTATADKKEFVYMLVVVNAWYSAVMKPLLLQLADEGCLYLSLLNFIISRVYQTSAIFHVG